MHGHSRKFWPPPGRAEPAAQSRSCDHPGCAEAGEFRAPKSRETLHDYYWFCLEHVRAYNAAWDYYAGMQPDEIEQVVRYDTTWQRPTWPLGRRTSSGYRIDSEKIRDSFGLFGDTVWGGPSERMAPPTPEEKAMRVMELKAPVTVELLKARYRELCKLHHPDANGGDKGAEERFKRIGQAYKTLMESLNP